MGRFEKMVDILNEIINSMCEDRVSGILINSNKWMKTCLGEKVAKTMKLSYNILDCNPTLSQNDIEEFINSAKGNTGVILLIFNNIDYLTSLSQIPILSLLNQGINTDLTIILIATTEKDVLGAVPLQESLMNKFLCIFNL